MQGDNYDYVSGFKLFYSDDAKNWKGYASSKDKEQVRKLHLSQAFLLFANFIL